VLCDPSVSARGGRMTATQSHKYRDKRTGCTVMAMESGDVVRVRELALDEPRLGRAYVAAAEWLEPLPMKYYGGQVPCVA